MDSISPITTAPKIADRSYTIERVTKVADEEYKVTRTTYTVTTYDRNGVVSTVTNSSTVNFLV
jgi:hypothetical protein